VPDTGSVATAAATTVAPPCVLTIGGLISAHTLCANVTTSVNPGASTATASVQDTTVSVLGVTLVLNEQTPVAGADQGLTVNAVHINALGLLDVVLASSTSDIHNC